MDDTTFIATVVTDAGIVRLSFELERIDTTWFAMADDGTESHGHLYWYDAVRELMDKYYPGATWFPG
jgi:hypothetical protein